MVVTGVYLRGENGGGTERDYVNVSGVGVERGGGEEYGGCLVSFDFEGLLENRFEKKKEKKIQCLCLIVF